MPSGLSFVDTNILIYRASPAERRKWKIATDLCGAIEFGLSTQVLQKFFVAATHPKKLNLSDDQALILLDGLLEFPLHVVDRATVMHALAIKKRYGISYWDAAVIASAKALDCSHIYTENLNSGQEYEGIHVVNPFI